jgi:hypothetical protein
VHSQGANSAREIFIAVYSLSAMRESSFDVVFREKSLRFSIDVRKILLGFFDIQLSFHPAHLEFSAQSIMPQEVFWVKNEVRKLVIAFSCGLMDFPSTTNVNVVKFKVTLMPVGFA